MDVLNPNEVKLVSGGMMPDQFIHMSEDAALVSAGCGFEPGAAFFGGMALGGILVEAFF